jgi:hypothetical protein
MINIIIHLVQLKINQLINDQMTITKDKKTK